MKKDFKLFLQTLEKFKACPWPQAQNEIFHCKCHLYLTQKKKAGKISFNLESWRLEKMR